MANNRRPSAAAKMATRPQPYRARVRSSPSSPLARFGLNSMAATSRNTPTGRTTVARAAMPRPAKEAPDHEAYASEPRRAASGVPLYLLLYLVDALGLLGGLGALGLHRQDSYPPAVLEKPPAGPPAGWFSNLARGNNSSARAFPCVPKEPFA